MMTQRSIIKGVPGPIARPASARMIKMPICCKATSKQHNLPEFSRRDAMMSLISIASSLSFVNGQAIAEDEGFAHLAEPTLAYEFDYPTAFKSGKKLPLVFSRKPERYSSAAPLTADARQRIVCELADLIDAVTVSVSVGPPAGTLR